MIETIELNQNKQASPNKDEQSSLKQRKTEDESANNNRVQDGIDSVAEKKPVVWEWEMDWWLIIYLTIIHCGAVYGIYRFFFTSWLTVLWSMSIHKLFINNYLNWFKNKYQ